MDKKLLDSYKDLLPNIKFSSDIEDQLTKYDPSIFESMISEIDPDSLAPNRTAKSAEHMAEKLDAMMEAFEKESAAQHKRSCTDRWIAIVGAVAAVVAAIAAVYPLIG